MFLCLLCFDKGIVVRSLKDPQKTFNWTSPFIYIVEKREHHIIAADLLLVSCGRFAQEMQF